MLDRSTDIDIPLLHWRQMPASKPPPGVRLREKIFTRIAGTMGAERVRWIWPGWIPRNKLTLLAGYPGVGKSYVALDVLARFTARLPLPGAPGSGAAAPSASGDPPALPPEKPGFLGAVARRAVLISGEDHPDDTISWRFASAGGDLSRLVIVDSIGSTASLREDPGADFVQAFSLDRDLYHLREIVSDWRTVELVIIDPIVTHCDLAEREPYLRKVLTELTRFALDNEVAILGIVHLRHDPATTDIYKALGSRALASIPRTIMTVQADPFDPQRRLVLPLKMNLGPVPPGLSFRFGDDRLVWDDKLVHRLASDPPLSDDPARSMVDDAIEYLRAVLAERDILATDLLAEGAKYGFRPRTLYRAKAAIKATSYRKGFGPAATYYWSRATSTDENRLER